jgi:hypothetical protein
VEEWEEEGGEEEGEEGIEERVESEVVRRKQRVSRAPEEQAAQARKEGEGRPDSGKQGRVPSWMKFSQVLAVRRLIETLVDKQVFCFSSIKRAVKTFVDEREEGRGVVHLDKPDGNDVRAMFRADMFESGAERLPPGDHGLSAEAATEEHRNICDLCLTSSRCGGV